MKTIILLVVLVVGPLSLVRGAALPEESDSMNAVTTELSEENSWAGIARCTMTKNPLDCVQMRSQRALEAMLAPGGRAASGNTKLEPEIVDKVGELSEIVIDAAAGYMESKIGIKGEDSTSKNLVDEGRGHKKKKKIHKLIALVKLVLLVLIVKLKLVFIMMKLQTLFQFKLVIMVFLILICKKISLWSKLKEKHDHKVVYYEHAQHQHHYDEPSHGWQPHDEHAESPGWGGSLWGRSYDTLSASLAQESQNLGIQSGVYSAADGTKIVVRPDAHSLAYGPRPTTS